MAQDQQNRRFDRGSAFNADSCIGSINANTKSHWPAYIRARGFILDGKVLHPRCQRDCRVTQVSNSCRCFGKCIGIAALGVVKRLLPHVSQCDFQHHIIRTPLKRTRSLICSGITGVSSQTCRLGLLQTSPFSDFFTLGPGQCRTPGKIAAFFSVSGFGQSSSLPRPAATRRHV